MSRLLIASTALLAVLVLGESTLRNNQRLSREMQSELRLLAPVPIADIAQIEIRAAGRADPCALARPHLANPNWTLHAAAELHYDGVQWPNQYLTGKEQLERLTEWAQQMAQMI